MRIIAGKYRGRNLKGPPSLDVRPTSDRLRETLFNVISPRIQGARFLDLCAGSGAGGIEALSRGAVHATFVDQSRKMCALVEANLGLCGIPEAEADVILSEAGAFIRRARATSEGAWDLIFFDPPYGSDYMGVLELIGSMDKEMLADEGLLIVEHHHKNRLPDDVGNLVRYRLLKQGDSSLSFFQRRTSTDYTDYADSTNTFK